MIEDGEAIMIKCDTSDMIADALTKALGPISYRRHVEKLTAYIAPFGTQNPATIANVIDEQRLKEAMKLLPNINAVRGNGKRLDKFYKKKGPNHHNGKNNRKFQGNSARSHRGNGC